MHALQSENAGYCVSKEELARVVSVTSQARVHADCCDGADNHSLCFEVGSKNQEVGSKEEEVWSRDQVSGSKEQLAGSRTHYCIHVRNLLTVVNATPADLCDDVTRMYLKPVFELNSTKLVQIRRRDDKAETLDSQLFFFVKIIFQHTRCFCCMQRKRKLRKFRH